MNFTSRIAPRLTTRASITALLALTVYGCGGGGGGGGGGSALFADGEPGPAERSVTTECGTVSGGEVVNPLALNEATTVQVQQILTSNVVAISVGGVRYDVKLFGVSSSAQPTAVKNLLGQFEGQTAYFIPSTDGCSTTLRGGSEVATGQLISESGVSFAELLFQSGIAGVAETTGTCGEELAGACYESLRGSGGGAAEASNFLWKPDSESPHNPGGVSILTNPCGVRVLINGQEIPDYGPSNGRCITARSGESGCSWGTNVKVELLTATGAPITFDGAPFITIPNGCERLEYKTGGEGGIETLPPVEKCETAPSNVLYRPADPACSGNASVILGGELAGAFSVQLRLPDGSDRLDPSCSEPGCTPYKVVNYIDGAGIKTACFGAPGTAPVMSEVVQTSVKLTADDSTPERFCIPDPGLPVN